jgi:hypothetical protein
MLVALVVLAFCGTVGAAQSMPIRASARWIAVGPGYPRLVVAGSPTSFDETSTDEIASFSTQFKDHPRTGGVFVNWCPGEHCDRRQ